MATGQVHNYREFAQALRVAAALVPTQANLAKRKLALEVLDGVVRRSPVDTGRFRGNWMVSLDHASEETRQGTDKDGAATFAAGQAVIDQAQPGQDIYGSNNLPYAEVLELGWSKQAPVGLVAVTLEDVATHYERMS